MRATLSHICEMSKMDFGLEQEQFDELLLAEGQEVEVLDEVTDGYYDIVLPNGSRFDAISRYHLENFNHSSIIHNLD